MTSIGEWTKNSDLSIPQILFKKKREKAIDKDNNLENHKEIMQAKNQTSQIHIC